MVHCFPTECWKTTAPIADSCSLLSEHTSEVNLSSCSLSGSTTEFFLGPETIRIQSLARTATAGILRFLANRFDDASGYPAVCRDPRRRILLHAGIARPALACQPSNVEKNFDASSTNQIFATNVRRWHSVLVACVLIGFDSHSGSGSEACTRSA